MEERRGRWKETTVWCVGVNEGSDVYGEKAAGIRGQSEREGVIWVLSLAHYGLSH